MKWNFLYADYVAWKDWERLFQPTEQESELYARELQGVVLSDRDFLDIGFGSGAFLTWAKQQGARVAGVEIQPELLDAAAARGIPAYPRLDLIPDASFDVVTAFDVLEHIPLQELPAMLEQIACVCRPGATILVRFPNCQSPAGLVNQFGDPTHLTMLSGPLIQFMMSRAGFGEIVCREAVLPASGSVLCRWIKNLAKPLKWVFESVYRMTWSIGSTPLTANVIVEARKAAKITPPEN